MTVEPNTANERAASLLILSETCVLRTAELQRPQAVKNVDIPPAPPRPAGVISGKGTLMVKVLLSAVLLNAEGCGVGACMGKSLRV